MNQVESANVPVVSEEFLDAIQKGGAELMLTQYAIAPWGGKVNRLRILLVTNINHNYKGKTALRFNS